MWAETQSNINILVRICNYPPSRGRQKACSPLQSNFYPRRGKIVVIGQNRLAAANSPRVTILFATGAKHIYFFREQPSSAARIAQSKHAVDSVYDAAAAAAANFRAGAARAELAHWCRTDTCCFVSMKYGRRWGGKEGFYCLVFSPALDSVALCFFFVPGAKWKCCAYEWGASCTSWFIVRCSKTFARMRFAGCEWFYAITMRVRWVDVEQYVRCYLEQQACAEIWWENVDRLWRRIFNVYIKLFEGYNFSLCFLRKVILIIYMHSDWFVINHCSASIALPQ